MRTLIAIQDEYIAKVNAGRRRWAHRKDGGHASRTQRAAWRRAERELEKLGYNNRQVLQALRDAREMADLIHSYGEEN
jgi:hypothetical protein